jgi:hypothetical protein
VLWEGVADGGLKEIEKRSRTATDRKRDYWRSFVSGYTPGLITARAHIFRNC